MTVPFPGGTAVSRLRVYDSPAAADGVRGGTPHLHLVSTEAYLVTAGTGRLETITREGFASTVLAPGKVVWFAPGTIHRAVTDGDLELFVLMAGAGLPEAGDAVISFPIDVLDDADAYDRAATLPSTDARDAHSVRAAAARRDRAVDGFLALRRAAEAGQGELLERTYRAAARLCHGRTAQWRQLLDERVLGEAHRVERLRSAIASGVVDQLGNAAPTVGDTLASERLGMCGVLQSYAQR